MHIAEDGTAESQVEGAYEGTRKDRKVQLTS